MTNLKQYLEYDSALDGRIIAIRAIKPKDKWCLQELFSHLGSRSRYFRFLTPRNELTDRELSYFTELDFVDHVGLIASIVENGVRMTAGTGRYIVTTRGEARTSAEFALTIEDEYHGLGIGTVLLKHLIKLARENGVTEFTALVLQENRKMLELVNHLNIPVHEHGTQSGLMEITMDLSKGGKRSAFPSPAENPRAK